MLDTRCSIHPPSREFKATGKMGGRIRVPWRCLASRGDDVLIVGAACLASSRGLQPFADLFEDGLELGIALERIEIIILENAFIRPPALENTMEGGEGAVGITT